MARLQYENVWWTLGNSDNDSKLSDATAISDRPLRECPFVRDQK
jgi:hypothetical protein